MSKPSSKDNLNSLGKGGLRARSSVSLVVMLSFLVGCEPEPDPRAMADFLEDSIAMDAKLRACRSDRRMAARDPECKAARQAAAKLSAAEQAARQDTMQKSSEEELERLRRQQEARDAAAAQRLQRLKVTAEKKLENGEPLTAEEARVLGIDPDSSVLVEGDEGT